MAALLFTISCSTDDPERSGGALSTALAAAEAGHDVALWLSHEGVRLAVKAVAETMREPWSRDAAALVTALTTQGVVLHADRDAFDRRELDADQLREGAVLAAPADLARLVVEGRVPVHV